MEIFEYGDRDAGVVLVQPVDEHELGLIGGEIDVIRENSSADFRLMACMVSDWNRELSPWEAPAVFHGDDFGDGAAKTLECIMKYCDDRSRTYIIGGYSLAGLFALWSAYRTGIFAGVAAASPSVWFPGFTDYMRDGEIGSGYVYLSLGDREEKTRNPVMATVGDNIRMARDILTGQGADCILEWNEGNHFKCTDMRMAKGFAWVINKVANSVI